MPSSRSLILSFQAHRALSVSAGTVKEDGHYLGRFVGFLESRDVKELAAVTVEHLAEYGLHLRGQLSRRGRQISTSYVSRSLTVAKLFLVWARQEGLVLQDFSAFTIARPLKKLVAVPSVEQVQRLLEAPSTETPEGLRDAVIWEFFYTLGLRAKECLSLDLESVDCGGLTLRVWGKGSRERLLPLSPRLAELVARYLREGRPNLRPFPEEKALWIAAQTGRRLGYTTMKQRLAAVGELQGLKVHPHLLRHSCATHLLEAGADVEAIGVLLGHQRADSTAHYAKVSAAELTAEHQRCHPRVSSNRP